MKRLSAAAIRSSTSAEPSVEPSLASTTSQSWPSFSSAAVRCSCRAGRLSASFSTGIRTESLVMVVGLSSMRPAGNIARPGWQGKTGVNGRHRDLLLQGICSHSGLRMKASRRGAAQSRRQDVVRAPFELAVALFDIDEGVVPATGRSYIYLYVKSVECQEESTEESDASAAAVSRAGHGRRRPTIHEFARAKLDFSLQVPGTGTLLRSVQNSDRPRSTVA